ncbi:hypothetical protein J8273_2030 [Carpediemonas membranifera]|uniref:Uncharacterized protein n=1 Tax=Carpediemonas membranifera TaxID=201153 RepID=A0A8J6B9X7_9EUKA|nr:hypothetical protein J8273_2030 [Carpediemonas membranifera]|eukprot:KAG9396299.1 hypothetical protein J8273_2030 [Carpediemonas membranifera]
MACPLRLSQATSRAQDAHTSTYSARGPLSRCPSRRHSLRCPRQHCPVSSYWPRSCPMRHEARSHILSAHATGLCLSAPKSSSSDDSFVPVELTGARMLSVHKNSTLVAVARISGVRVVDLDTSNASYLPVRAHIAAFSPDGSMIAMATASGVWLHSLRTARRSFFPTQRPITAMVWIESALVMAEHECTTLEVAVANPKTLVLSPIGGLGLQPVALGGAVLGGAVTNLVYADKVLHVTAGIRAGGRAHASLISMVVSIDAVPRGVVIRAGGTTDRVWGDVVPQLSAAPGVLCYLLDGEVMSVDEL